MSHVIKWRVLVVWWLSMGSIPLIGSAQSIDNTGEMVSHFTSSSSLDLKHQDQLVN